ncbi:winged helix-turn-helix transcriptional regulator (plasmid) [Bacillus megaterium]|nr:winged helix-turn-helix transcriptional regulator [Priestia megaterium]
MNTLTRTLFIRDEEVTLTAKNSILSSFLTSPNQVFTYDQIIEKIWGYNQGDFHSVRVYIGKLRDKIEEKQMILKYLQCGE